MRLPKRDMHAHTPLLTLAIATNTIHSSLLPLCKELQLNSPSSEFQLQSIIAWSERGSPNIIFFQIKYLTWYSWLHLPFSQLYHVSSSKKTLINSSFCTFFLSVISKRCAHTLKYKLIPKCMTLHLYFYVLFYCFYSLQGISVKHHHSLLH